jgi:hypothetical protein
MPYITRQVAAVTAALALSVAPALASTKTSSTCTVNAKTRLTSVIAKQTPLFRLKYRLHGGVDEGVGRNAIASSYAANSVSRVPADSAQLPEKLEWVLGAEVQRRADNKLAYGQHEKAYRHPSRSRHAVHAGVALLRLSNYFLANADSRLGIPHPRYMAEPYQPDKNKPIKRSALLMARAPKPTLAAIISMGTPLLKQTIPHHILGAHVELNEDAAHYYSVLVNRIHAAPAKRAAQHEWVDGIRRLEHADQQLSHGIQNVKIIPPHAATKREIQSALRTFRHADRQISHADAQLGLHASGPAVKLPTGIVYQG